MYKRKGKEEYLELAREKAKSRDGLCLTNEYINCETKMEWTCKRGHIWLARYNDVVNKNSWCLKCSGSERYTLEYCHKVAEEKGCKCLSTEYKNNLHNMDWECSEGHLWVTSLNNIKKTNTWCPTCRGLKKFTIYDCQKFASELDGKCLSTEYKNNKTKLKWECSNGHTWLASLDYIKNKNIWCTECSGTKRLTIDDCHKDAMERNGKCLTTYYTNYVTKMMWECKEGHTWLTPYYNIRNGHWCPECSGVRKHTIEECHRVSKIRNGKCLSFEYINATTAMKWECSKGHTWLATLNSIKNGSWCPYCGKKNESETRKIIESLTGLSFPTVRPKWLINQNGNRMEFDGYCEELKIAFEYHGIQHYKYVPFYHRGDINRFKQRQIDDAHKEKLSKKYGIMLIIIPYYIKDKNAFIIEELTKIDSSLIKQSS